MNFIELIIVGAIQGFLEFLPVSSSGNVSLILMNFLKLSPSESFSLSLFLHLGTLLAVLVYFRKDIFSILKNIKTDKTSHFLIVSTLITGIVGVPIYIGLKSIFENIQIEVGNIIIGLFLIGTGIFLRYKPKSGFKKVQGSNMWDMILAGVAQGISIIPGISRSGSTLAVLLGREFDKEEALRISFLMSIPAILGGIVLEAEDTTFFMNTFPAIIGAFITSIIVIKGLLEFAKRLNFSYFCIAFGAITVIISLLIL
ncbi:MAG: undecaprenyl pyrophosphate phosphatase [Candidatus Methanofastidiosum methylothiophilum]|uniref:Undecaprenyl-diphosphatase n=1 Tax=Candidatus Methanofastidiosum methylothiophilum TaxID=1705564 RepID=A0A150IQG8_9EURY|nr:MAG: undecaprenyl pyrophosphate phosphatase [Candidatus Methanofastidiosum methylthiophilus]KYC47256.1 MAG: undecaprenyl pyrophosphate phosphatase [Candidatus Methanofastidiosum methylthiophilus]KYC50350.1 MAG: undecaprenyl pyrophosphate phosphatase [Candidatus Methanofastidiosum methylthiophilus]